MLSKPKTLFSNVKAFASKKLSKKKPNENEAPASSIADSGNSRRNSSKKNMKIGPETDIASKAVAEEPEREGKESIAVNDLTENINEGKLKEGETKESTENNPAQTRTAELEERKGNNSAQTRKAELKESTENNSAKTKKAEFKESPSSFIAPYEPKGGSKLLQKLGSLNPCICCCCCGRQCCGLKTACFFIGLYECLVSIPVLMLAFAMVKITAAIFAVEGLQEGLNIAGIIKTVFKFEDDLPGSVQTVAGITAVQRFFSQLKTSKFVLVISGGSCLVAGVSLTTLITYDTCCRVADIVSRKQLLKSPYKCLSIICWISTVLVLLHIIFAWWSYFLLTSIINALMDVVSAGSQSIASRKLSAALHPEFSSTLLPQRELLQQESGSHKGNELSQSRYIQARNGLNLKVSADTRDTIFNWFLAILSIHTAIFLYFSFCSCILGFRYRLKLSDARAETLRQQQQQRALTENES